MLTVVQTYPVSQNLPTLSSCNDAKIVRIDQRQK